MLQAARAHSLQSHQGPSGQVQHPVAIPTRIQETLHSCETQLIITVNDLITYHDKKVQVFVAILDFSKAFNVVPHERLLQEVFHCGIRGNIHSRITSFLKDRSQCVRIDGARSDKVQVGSGVPQDTVMGPLLFLLYINDEVSSQVRLFADDCLLYRPIRSEDDQANLQRDLDSLWLMLGWDMGYEIQPVQVPHHVSRNY